MDLMGMCSTTHRLKLSLPILVRRGKSGSTGRILSSAGLTQSVSYTMVSSEYSQKAHDRLGIFIASGMVKSIEAVVKTRTSNNFDTKTPHDVENINCGSAIT